MWLICFILFWGSLYSLSRHTVSLNLNLLNLFLVQYDKVYQTFHQGDLGDFGFLLYFSLGNGLFCDLVLKCFVKSSTEKCVHTAIMLLMYRQHMLWQIYSCCEVAFLRNTRKTTPELLSQLAKKSCFPWQRFVLCIGTCCWKLFLAILLLVKQAILICSIKAFYVFIARCYCDLVNKKSLVERHWKLCYC